MPDESFPTDEVKRIWFEPVTAILMAVASLSTAWCSYQISLWSGQRSGFETHADKLEKQATAMHLEARQIESVQMREVMEVIDATLEGDAKRARFYADRFEGELKPAYEKWIAANPFENPDAPPHPFVPALYTPRYQQEIRDARAAAAQAESQSNVTGHTASTYLSNTVILATVLFFAGTVGKFTQRHVRRSSLAFAIVLFGYVVVRTLVLPVA
jgi:hypothetical protein